MVKVLLGEDRASLLTSKELVAKIAEKELLAMPSLKGLAYLLRHEGLWGDFKWNWCHVDHCAMGLARHQWPGAIRFCCTYEMCKAFGVAPNQVHAAFMSHKPVPWYRPFADPRPKDIARYIEKRLLK